MKVILIAPGFTSLPPVGWGAVESVVWDYYENLKKKNFNVYIVNTPDTNKIIEECNNHNADIIHIMYDDYIEIVPKLNCKKILYTSHYAYITNADFQYHNNYFNNIFKKVIEYKNLLTLNVISKEIADVYKKYGFDGNINILCNGAREDLFRFTENPKYYYKSIYIAKIEWRKSQYKYQNIPNIDFVGNYHDSPFNIYNSNYLGEWDKTTLYNNTTEYGNLILLSDGEADPLVVKEGLMAGLGIVVSECSAANLDSEKDFITIIPNNKLLDLEYINFEIVKNREYSIKHRNEIRQYAIDNFSWNIIIDKYCKLSHDNINYFSE
jgi:glycosyltransferase involved in cell wall biosynthesis